MSRQREPKTTDSKHLTQLEFYQACEALKKNRQRFIDERPTNRRAAEMLAETMKIPIAESSMATIREAAGVKWETKRAQMTPNGARLHAVRTLTTSLFRLYKKLGEEVPSSLSNLYDEETRRVAIEEKGAVTNGNYPSDANEAD